MAGVGGCRHLIYEFQVFVFMIEVGKTKGLSEKERRRGKRGNLIWTKTFSTLNSTAAQTLVTQKKHQEFLNNQLKENLNIKFTLKNLDSQCKCLPGNSHHESSSGGVLHLYA